MDAATLAALRGSIAKWKAIVAGTGDDLGRKNCPLCALFWPVGSSDPCRCCPVFERTGVVGCVGSPYTEYCDELSEERAADPDGETKPSRFVVRAAKRELKFLRSLLPDDAR